MHPCRTTLSIARARSLAVLILATSWSVSSYAQSDWVNVGPGGGYFPRIVAHPSDDDIVFAGSDDSGGVYKSTDGGSSWELVTEELRNACGWDICIDPNDSDTIYACDLYGRHPIIRSTDGGDDWTDITPGSGPTYGVQCSTIEVDPTDSDRIYVGTGWQNRHPGDGLWRSENGGSTWTQIGASDFTGDVVQRVAVQAATGYVFASVWDDGLYRSLDDGANWTKLLDYYSSTYSPVRTGLNVATRISPYYDYVWTCRGDLDETTTHQTRISAYGTSWYDSAMGDLPVWEYGFYNSDSVVYAAAWFTGVQKSTNGGASWSATSSSTYTESELLLGLDVATDGDVFVSTFGNEGIYRSQNGGTTWSNVNTDLNGLLCTDVEVAAADPYTIYVTAAAGYNDDDITVSQRSAVGTINPSTFAITWDTMDAISCHALNVEVDPSDEERIVVTTFGRGFYVSDDSGATATHYAYTDVANTGDDDEHATGGAAFDPDSNYLLVSGHEITFNETTQEWDYIDDPLLWISSNKGSSFSSPTTVDFLAVDMIQEDGGGYVWAATGDGVWRGDYDGTDWSQSGLDGVALNCVTQDPTNLDVIYAGAVDGTLYCTVNRGSSWFSWGEPGGLPDGAELRRIEVDPQYPYVLYLAYNGSERHASSGDLASGGGVYIGIISVSPPGIAYYSQDTSALTNNQAMGMAFHIYGSGERMMYVGTYEASVFAKDFQ